MNDRRTALARYESAIARAHRAVHNARMRALDLEWGTEQTILRGIMVELVELQEHALKGKPLPTPQHEGQEQLPF